MVNVLSRLIRQAAGLLMVLCGLLISRPSPAEAQARSEDDAPPETAAPGEIEVDEDEIATALERALVQQGALVLPPGVIQFQPSLSYVRREADAPAFLLPETGQIATENIRWDDVAVGLAMRVGLPHDWQLDIGVPYRREAIETVTRVESTTIGATSRDASGFADVAITLSKGLVRERGWRPDLIAGVSWDSKSGQDDAGIGLGSSRREVTVSLTATKSRDPLVFVASTSYRRSDEDGPQRPGDVLRLSLGTVLATSPDTSLRFFLDQNMVDEAELDSADVPGSDTVVSLFSIGVSSVLSSRMFLDVELSVGLTDAAPDYAISFALPIRF